MTWIENNDEPPNFHLDSYFNYVRRTEGKRGDRHIESMQQVGNSFIENHVRTFPYSGTSRVLLLGEIQSGKTAQILALLSSIADESQLFRTFILLTTSNISLHTQTLKRCIESLKTFQVCNETDALRYNANANQSPALIVLKKNSAVLKKWRNELRSTHLLQGRPLTVIDDEADATSLNTAVNRGEQSAISRLLDEISDAASSTLYVQVTATPQALFLQSGESGWKPSECIYFPPGEGYLGGSFFFSTPKPFSYRRTKAGELGELRKNIRAFEKLPDGFVQALVNYLLASSEVLLKHGARTSFLIHPSWTRQIHDDIHKRLTFALEHIYTNLNSASIQEIFSREWSDLQSSFPNIQSLGTLLEHVKNNPPHIQVLNSAPDSSVNVDFVEGSNIVIGGNSLGRGLTFPMLLTTYYCRETRLPQQDTIWQHCRMFGYDRIAGLSRMFMPGDLFDLFTETHQANDALIKLIQEEGASNLKILTSRRIRSTRRSVVDQEYFTQLVGGVNYYPKQPDIEKWSSSRLDKFIDKISPDEGDFEISTRDLTELLKHFDSDATGEWSTSDFVEALNMYQAHQESRTQGLVMIRRNRNVSLGTGTLLSPNDRKRSLSSPEQPVLVLYRLTGTRETGGEGFPFWVPNVNLPAPYVYNFLVE